MFGRMKLGSPEAMRQEPSNHAWEEREAARDAAEEAEEQRLEDERYEAMRSAKVEYDADKERRDKEKEQAECPHDEHDHGICLDCSKDIFDDLVGRAESMRDE